MAGWYVTANDIKNWTGTHKRRAEEVLPLLVKKLILASCRPNSIDFPSGDSVAVGGWDGILDVDEGNEFIPSGKSGWEFGTNSDVKKKADGDYTKRTSAPAPLKRDETTFVFATSRLWTKRDSWARTKETTNKWKDVKGINAESLANWLEACPAVHRWFSEMLGKRFPTIRDLEQEWGEYTNKTEVKLNSKFLLHKRENEAISLTNIVTAGNAEVHRIKAVSKIEAYGFILATLVNNDEANSRCLVIKSQESWDLMAASEQNLVLIPHEFTPSGIGVALANNHTVVIATDNKDTQGASINLNRQSRITRESALKELGFDDRIVSKIYQDTKGYIEPLLRHSLLKPIDYNPPKWPNTFSPEILFTALFISEWNESNKYDREIIEALSGMPYDEFQKDIIRLSKVDDAPLRQVGDVWQVISKMDFWLTIASKIAKPYLNKFGEIIPLVLSDTDPSYDLPPSERFMASVRGAIPKYSALLKQGVCDSLALLSTYVDEFSEQLSAASYSSLICCWIRKVFEENNNARFWFSLGRSTNLLAEAAPDEFIGAIETASIGESPIILGLFEAEGDAFSGGCYHSHLLWSLELLAWNKQNFARVSMCLARLSEIDSGGKWSNRPFNSLVDIYLGWVNNTSATHKERLQVLEQVLVRQYPQIAWRLMISLLLNKTNTSTGVCKPEYRDWTKDTERSINDEEYLGYVKSIVDLLIKEFKKDVDNRMPDLVESFDSYTEEQQVTIINEFLSINPDEVSDKARINILSKLRNTICHHREFPDSDWSWSEPLLEKLEEVYYKINFTDVLKASMFLFNEHSPNSINLSKNKDLDYSERERLILKERIYAIEKISEDSLEDLVDNCSLPYLVGECAFKSSICEKLKSIAIDWIDEEGSRRDFSNGFFSALSYDDFEAAKDIIVKSVGWSSVKKAYYLLFLPLIGKVLDLVDEMPLEGQYLFWSNVNKLIVSDRDTNTIYRVIRKLLENERPLSAIYAVSQLLREKNDSSELDVKLLSDILIRIATKPKDIDRVPFQSVSHTILECIEILQDAEGVMEKEICNIEWAYLNAFRSNEFSPRFLIKSVSEEPTFFSQLVTWAYKRNDNKKDSVEDISDELLLQRADIARKLLDSISILPSQKGNEIDENILSEWVYEARRYLSDCGRKEIGDCIIGKILSRCPIGEDGIWPHESVRFVLERYKSTDIDNALAIGRRNARGVTSRHPYAGGVQERGLAEQYKTDAERIQLIYPRTAKILFSIAENYELDAKDYDMRVELMKS
ncbi:hypothetical protein [Vibrio alginolyticus]|uniref:hypothetical protein n=1 Tax=Vibrio alginolyticus TaxID=663 RepID=UPI001BD53512|nr:hypothetical protein [Vibrio alginolyticus]MBS9834204.1 hypothetical protein [Vibrio alginolyticus]